MLSVRKVKLLQFDVKSSFTWRTKQDYRHFRSRRWKTQVDTLQVVWPSPMEQFRRRGILSVTDLVSPAWCEVQFEYGLRGKRSRPIEERPKSFVSSSGKKISIKKSVAEKNDVKTKEGQAVHKKLELQVRKIRKVELKVVVRKVEPTKVEPTKVVKISPQGERLASQFVNMLVCLKGLLVEGYMREMPVFGIVHDVVIFGTVDEISKVPFSAKMERRRARRARRAESMSPQNVVSSCLENREKVLEPPDRREGTEAEGSTSSISGVNPPTMLYLTENKTRPYASLPPDHDMLTGWLQLMLYRRLLSQLVAKSPLYDFNPLWEKLRIKSSSQIPPKILAKANVVLNNTGFQTITFDDLVSSWHELVKEADFQGVNENLVLVYRLRPPVMTQKGKAIATTRKDMPDPCMIASENSTAGPSNYMEDNATIAEMLREEEEARLRQSTMPLEIQELEGGFPGKKRSKKSSKKGIDNFKIIGGKRFLHNDMELDAYLTHVLKWWWGEREPVGVPMRDESRCSGCEYSSDCEWRIKSVETQSSLQQMRRLCFDPQMVFEPVSRTPSLPI